MKIGDYVGKWIITKIHRDRANDGHLLVDAKCSLCGFIKSRTLVGILRYSSGKTCNHFDKKCDWKSTTVTIELFGIVDSLSGWSKRIGFHRNYLCKHRSKYGMVSCINLIKEIMHP